MPLVITDPTAEEISLSKLNALEDWLSEDLITPEDYEKYSASLSDRFLSETAPVTTSGAEDQQMRDEIINNIIPMFNQSAGEVGNIDPIGSDKLGDMVAYLKSISGWELKQTYERMANNLNTQWSDLSRPWVNPKGIERLLWENKSKGLTEAQLIPDLWTSLRGADTQIKPPLFETYDMKQPWKPHEDLTPRHEPFNDPLEPLGDSYGLFGLEVEHRPSNTGYGNQIEPAQDFTTGPPVQNYTAPDRPVQNYTAPDRGDWGPGLHLARGGITSLRQNAG